MASREEIEAALEVAIETLGVSTPKKYDRVIAHLRAHLSRLREEEAFRDAAMEYEKWAIQSGAVIPQMDTSQSYEWMAGLGVRQKRLHETYRALEEPRNG